MICDYLSFALILHVFSSTVSMRLIRLHFCTFAVGVNTSEVVTMCFGDFTPTQCEIAEKDVG